MKDEKEKAITQFYPDYEYEDEEEKEEIRIIKPDIANRFRPNRPKFTVNLATNFFDNFSILPLNFSLPFAFRAFFSDQIFNHIFFWIFSSFHQNSAQQLLFRISMN